MSGIPYRRVIRYTEGERAFLIELLKERAKAQEKQQREEMKRQAQMARYYKRLYG